VSETKQIGMVGLGRMGGNLVRRLLQAGVECHVFDLKPEKVAELVALGAIGASSIEELVAGLRKPSVVWVMLKEGRITGRAMTQLAACMDPDDVIIDGGNTYYRDDIKRARRLGRKVHTMDCGTSGGVHGLLRGFCCMIGGEQDIYERLEWIFQIIAPKMGDVPRTPGRTGPPGLGESGYLYCGPHGAGHFVKMIHNAIEYGMMAAIGEGYALLKHANIGLTQPDQVETPGYYKYNFNVPAIFELWRRGSVVVSWLVDLLAEALHKSPDLSEFDLPGGVKDSKEGRWTAIAAVDEMVPAQVTTLSLFARYSSRRRDKEINAALTALRQGFGGHADAEKEAA
jgi:6-phosphogluconate dehydrogenase